MGTIILFIFLTAFYFLPSLIGKDRKNAGSIFLLNLLFGWSVIGWIVAFYMAAKD